MQRQTFAGVMSLGRMPRLAAAVHRLPASDAQVELAFAEDEQRRVRLTGRITVAVELQCQRCLAAFEHEIDTAIAGVVVADDAAAASVPHADEPILAADDTLDVQALVEDELLLALPIAAHCNNAACQTRYNDELPTAQTGTAPAERRTDNPFATLEQLRHGNKTDDSD